MAWRPKGGDAGATRSRPAAEGGGAGRDADEPRHRRPKAWRRGSCPLLGRDCAQVSSEEFCGDQGQCW